MFRYTLQRIVQLIPTLLGIYTIVFLLLRVLPGDPTLFLAGFHDDQETLSNLRVQLHLDEPISNQYLGFLSDMLHGDLGTSFISRRPVTEMIAETLPQTAVLAVTAMLFAVAVGVPLGMIAATRHNSIWDADRA